MSTFQMNKPTSITLDIEDIEYIILILHYDLIQMPKCLNYLKKVKRIEDVIQEIILQIS